jgi:ferritin-like metal-binding protein YciE
MRPFVEGTVGGDRLGWMEADRWARTIGYLIAHNIIDQNLSPEEVMTNHLIAAAVQV